MAPVGSSFSRCGSGLVANSLTCSIKSDCYFGPRNTRKKSAMLRAFFAPPGQWFSHA
jgi:hypothetical protein